MSIAHNEKAAERQRARNVRVQLRPSINGVNGAAASVKVGIGTQTPATPLHVAGGDVYASQAGSGVIAKSPDGTKCARIGIDDTGALSVSAIACP